MKKWILCLFCLFLVGCDAKELSELSIGTVLGIDQTKDGYLISCLIVGKEENETNLYKGEGSTVETALNNLNLKLSENLYLNHIQSVIVSEKVAKKGMKNVMQYFISNSSIQKNFYLFVTKEVKADAVLENLLKTSGNDYNIITNIFKYNDEIDFKGQENSFTSFLEDELSPNKEPILHAITLDKNTLVSADLAFFKKDKLVSFSQNTIGYAALMGEAKKITLELSCENNKSIIRIDKMKKKTKIKNGIISNTITGDLTIKENGCQFPIDTKKDKEKLKALAEKKLNKIVNQTIQEAQAIPSDIFGYQEMLNRFKQNKNHLSFSELKIENHSKLSTEKLYKKGDYHE